MTQAIPLGLLVFAVAVLAGGVMFALESLLSAFTVSPTSITMTIPSMVVLGLGIAATSSVPAVFGTILILSH